MLKVFLLKNPVADLHAIVQAGANLKGGAKKMLHHILYPSDHYHQTTTPKMAGNQV